MHFLWVRARVRIACACRVRSSQHPHVAHSFTQSGPAACSPYACADRRDLLRAAVMSTAPCCGPSHPIHPTGRARRPRQRRPRRRGKLACTVPRPARSMATTRRSISSIVWPPRTRPGAAVCLWGSQWEWGVFRVCKVCRVCKWAIRLRECRRMVPPPCRAAFPQVGLPQAGLPQAGLSVGQCQCNTEYPQAIPATRTCPEDAVR